MRIAYVGNFTQSHCTEVHIAKTLRDMGHTVIELQENGVHPSRLIKQVEGSDLFLFTRTWGGLVNSDHLRQLRKLGIPSASYHLDLYYGISRQAAVEADAFWATDHVFTPDGSPEAAEFFKSKNFNHHYLKPGVFKAECVPGTRRPELAHDVVFVGSGNSYSHKEWPYRGQLVQWLVDNYGGWTTSTTLEMTDVPRLRFGKYGHPERTMRNQDLNDLYASAKVVVGDSLCVDFKKTYYWSDRVYETIGRGGFLIMPYIKGLEEEFIDGETIVFYEFGNFDQLKEKIDYYLEHEDERRKIQQAGQEFVREHATYNNRLTQMLDTVFPEIAAMVNDRLESNSESTTHVIGTDLRINLGAGTDRFEGFVNVDHIDLPSIDVVHNLMSFPYPFEDESAVEIRAVDVLEHLDHYTADGRPSVIAFIEECHRILKPGGELFIQTPRYDAEFLWLDPSHVRGFHEQSFDFFDPTKHYGQTTGFYSKAKFSVRAEVLKNKNLRIWMVKQ